MTTERPSYLLAGGAAELERLQLQARVWEPDAEAMLDRIGVRAGARCIDLGCGAMGILRPLSRRVGPAGHVVGVDTDPKLLTAARAFVEAEGLTNVEILQQDAYATGLPADSFDLVHVRFVFAPVGHDDALLREMLRLATRGGTIAIQEPDTAPWNCFPSQPAWDRLKAAIAGAFRSGGGDIDAGRRMFGMLKRAGLDDVEVRGAVAALSNGHPYMRLPIQFATSLRGRILTSGLVSEAELDAAIRDCEAIARDPNTFGLSFIVNQVWGRKPRT